MVRWGQAIALAGGVGLLSGPANAAEGIDGASLGLAFGLPFAGLLLSIALGPLVAHRIWHGHYGKIALGWTALTLVILTVGFGPGATLEAAAHAILLEYLPFIVLLFALFTIAGGVLVRGNIKGSPRTNALLLTLGALLASFVGTTGASMILIRPVIRANDHRRHNAHVVVFFIFLVSNIGGSLTPLGDPPLFVGFLRGVDFFWTTTNLLYETLFVAGLTLAAFFAIDMWLHRREGVGRPEPTPSRVVEVRGSLNFILLAAVVAAILTSAAWRPGVHVSLLDVHLELQNILRDLVLVGLALLSLWWTPKALRAENGFDWTPIKEVAKIFAAIFICIVPVLAMLAAREQGALAGLVASVTSPDGRPNEAAYFWMTGALSSFLDNVPTYLVFFEMAGGNARELMGYVAGKEYLASTLAAISSGAVFMGANTYIGNAPNFMVYAIARGMGVRMPSFFGYMLWSGAILLPVFVLTTLVFFG
jgi:Na+/H+ antiporter NhaD/arsenite permease-like protein